MNSYDIFNEFLRKYDTNEFFRHKIVDQIPSISTALDVYGLLGIVMYLYRLQDSFYRKSTPELYDHTYYLNKQFNTLCKNLYDNNLITLKQFYGNNPF